MRTLPIPLSLALVTVLVACGATGAPDGGPSPSTDPDVRAATIASLNADVEAVARAQRGGDTVLRSTVDAIAALDAGLAALRDPERVDRGIEGWRAARAALTRVDVQRVRDGMREVAGAVDLARSHLVVARQVLDDPWEQRYLAAQDDVLTAVRAHAAAGDALAQVIGQHLPVYERAVTVADTFVEQRWLYRSADEASDALEVELGPTVQHLRDAREQVATFVARRDDAAGAVNVASEQAAAVWVQRPDAHAGDAGP